MVGADRCPAGIAKQSGRIVFEELELPSASNFNVVVIHAKVFFIGVALAV